jgi:hypothetical protein
VPAEIHALVENAHDIYLAIVDAVEQHVRSGGEFPVSRPDFRTGSPDRWASRDCLDRLPELTRIGLGLLWPPGGAGIVPDLVQVLPGAGPKRDADH